MNEKSFYKRVRINQGDFKMRVKTINKQTAQNSQVKNVANEQTKTEQESIFESKCIPFGMKFGAFAAQELKENLKTVVEIAADFGQEYGSQYKERLIQGFETGKKVGEFIKALFE